MKLNIFVGSMIFFSSMAYSMEECLRGDYACRIAQCIQKLSTEQCEHFVSALRQHPMVDCINEFDNLKCQEYTGWLCDAAASGMYDAVSCAHGITQYAANQFQLSIVRALADDSLCVSSEETGDSFSLLKKLAIAGFCASTAYWIYKELVFREQRHRWQNQNEEGMRRAQQMQEQLDSLRQHIS